MTPEIPKQIRPDYQAIMDFVEPNSRVLDLGCGDGTLLALLIEKKSCQATGIEIDEKEIYRAMEKGVTVSHGDIDSALADYSDKRFDYVILHESLQQVLHPQKVILKSCRVGKKVIVGIPNFCHFSARLQLFFRGRVPVTKELPHQWYDTPNLRFLSLKDFESFCKINGIEILDRRAFGLEKETPVLANLCAHVGIFLLKNKQG